MVLTYDILHISDIFAACEIIRALDALKADGRNCTTWTRIRLDDVMKCLEDLIEYFEQPNQHLEHELKQNCLRALSNRQNLFQEEVSLLHFVRRFH